MCLLASTIIFISAAECKMNPTVRLPIFPQLKKKNPTNVFPIIV